MKASVIVLSWNGMDYLEDCLNGVLSQDYADFEVIVVDNGSTDGSADFVAEHYSQVRLIRNERNLGFAAGSNVGLRAATGDVLVLLNQDTVVQPGWLVALVAAFQDLTVGIAGCKVLYPDGSIQHAGGFIYGPRAETEHTGRHELDDGRFDQMHDADFVTGAALAISRPALERVGLLDEGFHPAYYEDVDWCYTTREVGFCVVYVPTARLIHHETPTAQREGHEHRYALHRGRIRFIFKHWTLERLQAEFVPAEQTWMASMGRSEELMAARRAYLNTILALPGILAFRSSSEEEADTLVALLTNLRATAVSGLVALQTRPSLSPVPYEPLSLFPSTPPVLSGAEQEADQEKKQGDHKSLAGDDTRLATTPTAGETEQETDREGGREITQRASQEADWAWVRLLAELEARQVIRERPFTSQVPVVGRLIVTFRRLWNSVAAKWYVRPLIQQQSVFNTQVVGYLRVLGGVLQDQWAHLEQHGQALEQHGQIVGWLSRRTDQLEHRSTEQGRLLQGQLRDVAENIREIDELAEHLSTLTRALSAEYDETT